jgi:pyruvate dehydrogenase E1 component alpha subunit/2-oxoisovalerate dehydrogenase E1 component alpha subunit
MKSSTTKTAKGAKGKANGAGAGASAEARSPNGAGNGSTEAEPFIFLPPPAAEALSVSDPLNEHGELVCTGETTLTAEQMLELYRWLQLTRLVEEKLVNLYRQTKVVGGVFRSLGQEATAVGTCYALRPTDFIAPIIRDLGAVLVKGIRPRDIFAQYMAKAWGPSEGRDLNIHFGDLSKGFIGPISHLGDMIPVMTGIVLAARMQKKETVAVAYIGDGGMSTGAFHEGLNFAAVQRLPLVIVAEHNWYAYSTPTSKQCAVTNLADKAAGYGIPGYVVDGNDVVACYEVMKRAAEFARGGGGSVLIEAKTYRRKGHAEHDDQRYIPAGELETWEKRDPVERYDRHLISSGVATREKLDEITADARREVEEDAAWAESSPMPEAEKAAYNVFDNSRVPPAFRPKVFGRDE